MSPHRPRRSTQQLHDLYLETLDALRRRFEQLEAAVAAFEPDLDEHALSAAWHSDDPLERNRADAVLSCFEKTYMLTMDLIALAVKLGQRTEAIDPSGNSSAVTALGEAGVISKATEQSLAVQREVRNQGQHIYVELSVPALRGAVNEQLRTVPMTINKITAWVDSLDLDGKH